MQIVASDQGTPEQTAETSITVAVQRDEYLPVITPPSGNMEFDVNTEVGVTIMTIRATDNDITVSTTMFMITIVPTN